MFILNQDRTVLQNVDRIGFIELRGNQIVTECGRIGSYKDEERAKEVFEDMIYNLAPALVLQNVELPDEMREKLERSNFLICDNKVTVHTINPIYQMPNE